LYLAGDVAQGVYLQWGERRDGTDRVKEQQDGGSRDGGVGDTRLQVVVMKLRYKLLPLRGLKRRAKWAARFVLRKVMTSSHSVSFLCY
jgi:hypothetical protein